MSTVMYVPSMSAQLQAGIQSCIEQGLKPRETPYPMRDHGEIIVPCGLCGAMPKYYQGPLVEQALECPNCKIWCPTWGQSFEFVVGEWNYHWRNREHMLETLLNSKYDHMDWRACVDEVHKFTRKRRQSYQEV
jgi:hypothetical protein